MKSMNVTHCLLTVLFMLCIATGQANAGIPGDMLQNPEVVIARDLIQKMEGQNPFPAAETLCTTGWKYLALLGDQTAIPKLREKAASDEKSAFRAQDALLLALGKPERDRLLDLAAASDLPLDKRLPSIILCSNFAQAHLDEMPWQIDKLFYDTLKDANDKRYLSTLQTMANYQCSTQTAEYLRNYLNACVSDSSQNTSLPVNECLMGYAIQVLEKSPIHDAPETKELLSSLIQKARWTSVQCEAARALAKEGQVNPARDYFRKLLASKKSEADRVSITCDLALIGDPSSMDIIKKALTSSDPTAQREAWQSYLSLGDDSFIEDAIARIKITENNSQLDTISVSDTLNRKSATSAQKKTALHFLVALYEHRSEDLAKIKSLEALLMCDDQYLQPVLAPCLQSLKAPLPKAPESINKSDKNTAYTFMRHALDTIVVMRVGKPDEKQAALQRFRELYMSARAFSKFRLPDPGSEFVTFFGNWFGTLLKT